MRRTPRPRPRHRSLSGLARLSIGLCCVLGGWLSAAAPATELRFRPGLPAFAHTSWAVGAHTPGDVWDIAQSEDGYLWLATGMGLYRFDGRSFERQMPATGHGFRSHNMTTLKITRNGDLWVGYFNGGVSRLSGGTLTHYGADAGMPPGMVFRIETDAAGRLWAAVEGGLVRFDGQRWQPADDWNYHGDSAQWLLRDRRGTLWVSDGRQLLTLEHGSHRFVPTGQTVARAAVLAERPDGEVWLADAARGLLPLTTSAGTLLPAAERDARTLSGLSAVRIRFLRDGSLWGTDRQQGGLFRIRLPAQPGQPGRIERFGAAQGLTSNTAVPLLEDREGNLWVGTNLGLNRFSRRSVGVLARRFPETARLHSVFRATDGSVFGYGADNRPLRLDRALVDGIDERLPRPPQGATPPVWMTQTHRLWRAGDDDPVAVMPEDGNPQGHLYASGPPQPDGPWVCRGQAAPMRLLGIAWQPDPDLPGGCTAIADGADGATLFGYPDGVLRVRDGSGITAYGPAQGLTVGPITAILAGHDLLLVAGEWGLAMRGDDGRFHQVREEPAGMLDAITGIARDRHERLWFNGGRGLLRVGVEALRAAVADGTALDGTRLYDAVDGLPGIAMQAHPTATVALADDGLLWLVTNQGLAWLDTRQADSLAPPKVFISDITIGDSRLPYRDGLVLPEGTRQLRIGYLATSLTRPSRVRYRVRLDGVDSGWQDTGDLQRASYTNLAPGDYRFQVIAANEDGVWNTTGASGHFRIEPGFMQTPTFKLAGSVAFVALLLLGLRLRARQLASRVRTRLEERYRERERIARELHDTLLQGTQGLILRLHASSLALEPQHPVRQELETAMDLAEQSLAQGRERLRGLRESRFDSTGLGHALLQIRNEAVISGDVDLRMLIEGTPRPLRAHVSEELYLIGREALLNAFRHSGAASIEIELGYEHKALRLRIRDDGSGLPDAAELQSRSGHWGMRGMLERAERIGARIQVWSRPQAGTEIQVVVPGRRAYPPAKRRRWWPWRRPPAPMQGENGD